MTDPTQVLWINLLRHLLLHTVLRLAQRNNHHREVPGIGVNPLLVSPLLDKMATAKLSLHERHYIVSGIEADFRADGRSRKDFRSFNVHQGVISNTNGSAQLQLVSQIVLRVHPFEHHVAYPSLVVACVTLALLPLQGSTCVLVGVKAELGTPHRLTPDQGRMEFFVDWYVWGGGRGGESWLCLTADGAHNRSTRAWV